MFGEGIVFTARLLDADAHTIKIGHFTKWDRNRLTELESIFTKIKRLHHCTLAKLIGEIGLNKGSQTQENPEWDA